MTNWNELIDRAYKTACEHGWHDEDWSDEHLLCLVVCELMEAVQADRKGIRADKIAFENIIKENKEYFPEDEQSLKFRIEYGHRIKGSVEEELADACIRIFDLSGLRGINLNSSVNYTHLLSGSYTEIIYDIIKNITNIDYPLQDRTFHALSQIFALADILDIDLMWFIETKMKYNEMREYKHGCKY